MREIEDHHKTHHASADAMVQAVVGGINDYAVCAGRIEINRISPLLVSLMWLAAGIGLVAGMAVLDAYFNLPIDPLNALQFVVVGAIVVYAYLKGFRARPDALVVSDETVWILAGVLYNRRTRSFTLDKIFEIARREIVPVWNFELLTLKFRVPGKIKVTVAPGGKPSRYYKTNVVSRAEAKRRIFAKQ